MNTGGPNATISVLNGTQEIDSTLQLNSTTDVTISNSGDTLTLIDVSGVGGMNNKGAGTLVINDAYTASGTLSSNAGSGTLTLSRAMSPVRPASRTPAREHL